MNRPIPKLLSCLILVSGCASGGTGGVFGTGGTVITLVGDKPVQQLSAVLRQLHAGAGIQLEQLEALLGYEDLATLLNSNDTGGKIVDEIRNLASDATSQRIREVARKVLKKVEPGLNMEGQ